jgi:starvation-inducible DNA-binding protein
MSAKWSIFSSSVQDIARGSKSRSSETIEVLEELLAYSIPLRDMYKNARWQTADIQFQVLRQLFDGHHRQQIELVDCPWTREYAVGRVVLANHEQVLAIREQLRFRKRMFPSGPTSD